MSQTQCSSALWGGAAFQQEEGERGMGGGEWWEGRGDGDRCAMASFFFRVLPLGAWGRPTLHAFLGLACQILLGRSKVASRDVHPHSRRPSARHRATRSPWHFHTSRKLAANHVPTKSSRFLGARSIRQLTGHGSAPTPPDHNQHATCICTGPSLRTLSLPRLMAKSSSSFAPSRYGA